jgi:hypothetical protein
MEEVGIDITGASITMVNNTQSGESEKVLKDSGERVLVHMRFNDFAIKLPQPAADIPIICDDDFTSGAWIPVQNLSSLKLTEPTQHTLQKLGFL